MAARHYYRFDQDEGVMEVTGVLRWGYVGQQKAEEGSAGMYEIVVDDPDMEYDFVGHRRWTVYEDESDDANEVIIDGLTQAVKIAHTGADIENPTGRVWSIEIADMNTLWTYRVMTGSDSQFAAQTDVERMQQLIDSEEMGYFSDTSLFSTASPVSMDKLNGRGQTTGQIADQCAQQSGKNWYIYSFGVHGEYSADFGVWYGKDSLAAYTSPIALSNNPNELDMSAVDDGTATTYPIGADTVLRRDYARQYDGAYGEFAHGAKYVRNPAVSELITVTHRDMVHPAPEIKTRAKMTARLNRVLADHATPDEVISTTVTLPPNKVSQVRPGMFVRTSMSHGPGYEGGRMLRVMSATYKPIGRLYEVALELQGPGSAPPASSADGTVTICNDFPVEDRHGGPDYSTFPAVPGETVTFRITQPQHEPCAFTTAIKIITSTSGYLYKNGVVGFDFNTPGTTTYTGDVYPPEYGPVGPGGAGPSIVDTGTFVVPSSGDGSTGLIGLETHTNGYAAPCDHPGISDCWTLELWHGDVEDEL